ncbi:S-layer family protein [Natranaerovirga pectinivora]|uniref:S-layer family protein n=1 Tax=Natranaerovirga pectinivora TaxID=682400 RepID=A0A4R3MM17_9FIRM|nr:S-layer homology domain-containing protein [Natranaerovirga pectinivora]TCT13980.1 S-layer family protein [Natranaerovirga pectinivora]
MKTAQMKKKLSVLLMVIIILTSINITAASNLNLKNINDHWAKNQIEELVSRGIINGYEDGTFRPENTLSTGEYLKLVIAALGFTGITNATSGHWANDYRTKAVDLGIIKSNDYVGNSQLNRPITRTEMTRIIVNAYEYKEKTSISVNDDFKFIIKDYNNIGNNDVNTVLKSYKVGLIVGDTNNNFRPNGNATRAEATTVIMRLIDKSYRVIIDPDSLFNTVESLGLKMQQVEDFGDLFIELRMGTHMLLPRVTEIVFIKEEHLPFKIENTIIYSIEKKVYNNVERLRVVQNRVTGMDFGMDLYFINDKDKATRIRGDKTLFSGNIDEKKRDGVYDIVSIQDIGYYPNWKDFDFTTTEYILFTPYRDNIAIVLENPWYKK